MGGGGSQKTVEYNKTDPWAGQQPYLSQAFSEAQSIYGANKDKMPLYEGDFVATPSADQQQFNKDTLGWAMGQGQQNINKTQALSGAAAGSGLFGGLQGMNGLFGLANQDYTGSNIANANAYANNPAIADMTKAAMSDAVRTANEQTRPGISAAAAASGNLNNSGTSIQNAIVERGLNDKAADISANLRGQAWNAGLAQSAADNQLRQQAMGQAAQMGQGLFSLGLGGMQGLGDMAQTNAVVGQLGSSGITADKQAELDNAMQRAEFEFNQPWANLQNYWNIVGDKSWGSEGYSVKKTTSQPSALSTIGSVAGIMGSLFKCDVRAKKNIVFKTVIKGHRFYEFEYHGEDGKHFGPIAQEVEIYQPRAVVEIDGVKHVDMTALLGA